MRGHVDRVRELLESGFSADAESVRCLCELKTIFVSAAFDLLTHLTITYYN